LKAPATYTEAALLQLLRQRSEAGFDYLYTHYSGALLQVISGILPDQSVAEDVLQEVFVRIYQKLHLYDEQKSRLYTWMAQIARNAAIDKHRQQQNRPGLHNQKPLESVHDAVESTNPDTADIRFWVNKLDKPEKEVVVLAYLQGFTQEEIGQLLNTPLGTVKSRVRSGLKKLRQMMTERS
jgi:RNA polymerase sigma-70 factor (ECF subfamily)